MNSADKHKICLFNSSVIWGGGEKWHFETALKLQEKGYDPVIFCNKNGLLYSKAKSHGFACVPISIKNLSFINPLKLLYIHTQLRKYQPRTIIVGLTSDLKAVALIAKITGVDQVIYRRGTALPLKNNLLNKILYTRFIDALVVNSKEIRNILIKHNGKFIDSNNIHLIYNEVDIKNERNRSVPPSLSEHFDGVILGNIGRLVEQKGQEYLVQLAHRLKYDGIRFKILIAGSGKLEHYLKSYAQRLGVEDEVVFLNFIEDIHSFIQAIDIFIFPSLHEGSSHTLLEVMPAKKPVVAFNISSIPEIVEHNKNGFLVEKGDTENLYKYVSELINREDLRKSFGLEGRKKIEHEFNSNRGINKLIRLINPAGDPQVKHDFQNHPGDHV